MNTPEVTTEMVCGSCSVFDTSRFTETNTPEKVEGYYRGLMGLLLGTRLASKLCSNPESYSAKVGREGIIVERSDT